MKRVGLVLVSAAMAALPLFPGTAAGALVTGGYTVTRMVLPLSRLFAVAVDPATGLVYASGNVYANGKGQGMVTVSDGSSQAVEGSIPVPYAPADIAVDPATDTIYTDSPAGLTVIDGATNTVVTTVTTGSGSGRLAVDPATNTVYEGTILANKVPGIAVVDGATNSVTATIALGAPVRGLAADAATGTLYAATYDGTQSTLYSIAEATNTVTKSVQLASYSRISDLAFDSAAGSLYAVDNSSANRVEVVNAATLAVTASITGCPYHVEGVAADPTANRIFVSSAGTWSPSPAGGTCVIDAAANTVAETFPRGGTGVAADPVTGAAYIAAWSPDNSIWAATPSATDELSPMVFGFGPASTTATFVAGVASSHPLLVSATPTATLTETGALPPGVTMSSAGVFSGTPAAGTAGTYPITVSASNGVSPDSTVSLKIVVDIAPAITSPASATFQTGVPGSFTVQATGSPTPTVGASGYPSWMTFTAGNSSGVLSGTPPQGAGGVYSIRITADNGTGIIASQTLTLTVKPPAGLYTASGPVRIMDTRNGTGGVTGSVGPGQVITLPVAGQHGVPADATAVVLNVTATGPTKNSYVTVYPDGRARPLASNLNFTAGETIPNLVVVPLVDGKIDFYNYAGNVNLIADLAGYYTPAG